MSAQGTIFDAQVEFAKLVDRYDPDRKARWFPPQCDAARRAGNNEACKHGSAYHLGTWYPISDQDAYLGLRRGVDQQWRYPSPRKTSKNPAKVPKRTVENITACAALGLAYWSEAPGSGKVYAVDDEGYAHTVLIDRQRRRAEHYCASVWRYNPDTQQPRHETKKRCDGFSRDVEWEHPHTMGELMALMDPPPAETDPNGLTGQCKVGNHHRCSHRRGGPAFGGIQMSDGSVYRCSCDCHTVGVPVDREPMTEEPTEEEKPMPTKTPPRPGRAAAKKREEERRAKAAKAREIREAVNKSMGIALYNAATPKPMSREQARALLLHDPDYLGDITNEALVDLLEDESVKRFHAKIRTELRRNRGLVPKKAS